MAEVIDNAGVLRAAPLEVRLIGIMPRTEELIAFAARTTWKGHKAESVEDISRKRAKALCDTLTACGHGAGIEFAWFVFDVRNASRSLTHQLVRHRMASYMQESQHYIDYEGGIVVVEPDVANEEEREAFYTACREANYNYNELVEMGMAPYVARQVLPNATASRIVVGMNARSLYNFFGVRCCHRNTPEIKKLAWKMLRICKSAAPELFRRAGPRCWQLGFCPEGKKTCAKYGLPVRSFGQFAVDNPELVEGEVEEHSR